MPIGAERRGARTTGDAAVSVLGARRAVVGWIARHVDGSEESSPRPGDLVGTTLELLLERARHADAVLVHREPVVAFGNRKRAASHHVVLVGGVDQPATECREVDVLPVLDGVDHRAGLGAGVLPEVRFGIEP